MDDIVKSNLLLVGTLLEDHKGEDTVILDISEQSSWTEGFVITTVNSQGHLKGLVRQLKETLEENNVYIQNSAKHIEQEGWTLLDCGSFVVHLMSRDTREFYDLEKLWHSGKVLKGSEALRN